jgi:hypothetical protein
VCENRLLRRIFRATKDDVTGEWRKLHNKKLNDLNSSSNIEIVDNIEMNEMGGTWSAYGGGERRVKGLGGKT